MEYPKEEIEEVVEKPRRQMPPLWLMDEDELHHYDIIGEFRE